MRRGEDEGFLKISIEPDEDNAIDMLNGLFIKGKNGSSKLVENAIKESWKRLLSSSRD